jgi:hypothetical protein
VNWEVYSVEVDPLLPLGDSRLLVAGYFGGAGGKPAHRLAVWDGHDWSTALGQIDDVQGLVDDGLSVFSKDSGLTPGYYIGGEFSSVDGVPAEAAARRSAKQWNAMGQGAARWVGDLALYDENADEPGGVCLYLGGGFPSYHGQPANALLRWDGVSWSTLPSLLTPQSQEVHIHAMCAHDDDGAGPRRPGLYVGGVFNGAGTVSSRNVIRWDGQQWEPLELGLNETVKSFSVFDDDGPGPRAPSLFVGGSFTATISGSLIKRIARWDGQAWSAVPEVPLFTGPRDMLVWDSDAEGPLPSMLFLTGPGYVIKWRGLGQSYQYLEGGNISGGVGSTYGLCLGVWDEDGPGPNPGGLYVGANFTMAGNVPANFIARWGCPLPGSDPCYPDCNLDGALTLADFGCFQTWFAMGFPYANCNGDGVINLADFGCFQTRFALGCP